jgi:hypothetical protein
MGLNCSGSALPLVHIMVSLLLLRAPFSGLGYLQNGSDCPEETALFLKLRASQAQSSAKDRYLIAGFGAIQLLAV